MLDFLSIAIGIIIGLLLAILAVVTMIFLKAPIQSKTNFIEKAIANAGPRPKGFLFDPPDELDEEREKIIEKNRREGRDTPIDDLRIQ